MATKQSTENPFGLDFGKILTDFKIPNIDFEAYVAAVRKNVDALSQANRLAYEGLQAIAKRQIEIVRQSLDQAASAAREAAEPGTPHDKAAKQAELAKSAFEHALANLRELGELVTKANNEAFDLIQARFTQSLDEVREQIVKLGK